MYMSRSVRAARAERGNRQGWGWTAGRRGGAGMACMQADKGVRHPQTQPSSLTPTVTGAACHKTKMHALLSAPTQPNLHPAHHDLSAEHRLDGVAELQGCGQQGIRGRAATGAY